MHHEALEKIIHIARKNPKILLSPTYFEKICTRLDIETTQTDDLMTFRYDGQEAHTTIINPHNCQKYKCVVKEGKNGVMIFEFINVLVKLLAAEEIPPSPHEKLGSTAAFYCERGIDILENKVLRQA